MIYGNSLYRTVITEMGIFLDRFTSSFTISGLHKTNVSLPEGCDGIHVGDLMVNTSSKVAKASDTYFGIIGGGPTLLSMLIKWFINSRSDAKSRGDMAEEYAYKLLTTAIVRRYVWFVGDVF